MSPPEQPIFRFTAEALPIGEIDCSRKRPLDGEFSFVSTKVERIHTAIAYADDGLGSRRVLRCRTFGAHGVTRLVIPLPKALIAAEDGLAMSMVARAMHLPPRGWIAPAAPHPERSTWLPIKAKTTAVELSRRWLGFEVSFVQLEPDVSVLVWQMDGEVDICVGEIELFAGARPNQVTAL